MGRPQKKHEAYLKTSGHRPEAGDVVDDCAAAGFSTGHCVCRDFVFEIPERTKAAVVMPVSRTRYG